MIELKAGIEAPNASEVPLNDENRDLELLRMARAAMGFAYSPYSEVQVGAVALTADGQIYPGCNVENASLGLTVCAERVALFNALAHGSGDVRAVVLTSNHPKVATPCGACRQVLLELAPEARVVFGDGEGVRKVWESPRELLPDAFEGDWRT